MDRNFFNNFSNSSNP